jgi:bifunctional non-homologous end joining protein LigD
MLARSGRPPASGDFAYEVKWDGLRAILSTEGPLPVRSRRGWNMTEHLQFLVHIPVRVVLDGELVAFDEDGKPDFPLVYERVLHGAPDDRADLHRVRRPERRGRDMTREAYSERRRILEEMQLSGRTGAHPRRSTTAPRSGRPCASTSSREWS